MTRLGFRSLVGVLLAVAIGGGLLALPTPGELGVRDEVECGSIWDPPREMSSVRLLGCELDLGAESLAVGPTVHPDVLPPAARALRERVMQTAPGAARERFRERHAAELRVTLDLEGRISFNDWGDWVDGGRLERSRREPIHRAFGISLLLFSLSLLWLTVRLDKRWRLRSEDLASGTAKPKAF